MQLKNKKLFCGLIMDEMSIMEDVHYNGERLQDYINFGCGMGVVDDCDALPRAKKALVFLIVALNSNWKLPVGYFLINGITAEDKSNLIITCLRNLHETGVIIKTFTFDRAASNLSMTKHLGCNFIEYKTLFDHPVTQDKIHVFLDASHMLKLIRNTLGDWGVIYTNKCEAIQWNYFKSLVDLQERGGLHLETKIRRRHINYKKEKMKVRLAAQTFSTSMADALTYCFIKKYPNFIFCNITAEFCRRVNDIFDFLNIRNFLSKKKCKRTCF